MVVLLGCIAVVASWLDFWVGEGFGWCGWRFGPGFGSLVFGGFFWLVLTDGFGDLVFVLDWSLSWLGIVIVAAWCFSGCGLWCLLICFGGWV